jgi:thymidylate synthase
MSFDLSEGHYPLVTTKKVSFRNIFYELSWFMKGDCDVKFLQDNGVHIWDGNAADWGKNDLGPIYGKQFRASGPKEIDQIAYCLDLIKKDPTSRRIVISLWNPSDLGDQALPCCHGTVIQFFVINGFLSLQMYQRSADVCLGLPYNIASYSLLLIMMAHCTGLEPGKVKIVLGDSHIYESHIKTATEQVGRYALAFPELRIKNNVTHKDPANFEITDFVLCDYQHLTPIKFDFVV